MGLSQRRQRRCAQITARQGVAMDGWGAAQLFVTSSPMANNCKILGSEYPCHGISFISPLLRWPLAGAGDQGWDQGGFIAAS